MLGNRRQHRQLMRGSWRAEAGVGGEIGQPIVRPYFPLSTGWGFLICPVQSRQFWRYNVLAPLTKS